MEDGGKGRPKVTSRDMTGNEGREKREREAMRALNLYHIQECPGSQWRNPKKGIV